jgi:hypothetical protein
MKLFQSHLRPSFLIIGTEKGGTTSFFHHLAQHPRILPPREKEVCFFNKDMLFAQGADWYHRQFPQAPWWSGQKTFEASPAYLYYPGVAARIASYAPRMKLIAMLRDPVERAFSAWNMHRQLRDRDWPVVEQRLATQPEGLRRAMLAYYESLATGDFTATVRALLATVNDDRVEPGLIKRGLYARQITEFRKFFPAEQLLVLESACCRAQRTAELDRVADFLGIERVPWDKLPVEEKHHHSRPYDVSLPAEAETLLRDFYRLPNEDLFALLGVRYPWNK